MINSLLNEMAQQKENSILEGVQSEVFDLLESCSTNELLGLLDETYAELCVNATASELDARAMYESGCVKGTSASSVLECIGNVRNIVAENYGLDIQQESSAGFGDSPLGKALAEKFAAVNESAGIVDEQAVMKAFVETISLGESFDDMISISEAVIHEFGKQKSLDEVEAKIKELIKMDYTNEELQSTENKLAAIVITMYGSLMAGAVGIAVGAPIIALISFLVNIALAIVTNKVVSKNSYAQLNNAKANLVKMQKILLKKGKKADEKEKAEINKQLDKIEKTINTADKTLEEWTVKASTGTLTSKKNKKRV